MHMYQERRASTLLPWYVQLINQKMSFKTHWKPNIIWLLLCFNSEYSKKSSQDAWFYNSDYNLQLQLPITSSDHKFRSQVPITSSDYKLRLQVPIASSDCKFRLQVPIASSAFTRSLLKTEFGLSTILIAMAAKDLMSP